MHKNALGSFQNIMKAIVVATWIELNLLTNSQWRQAKAWRAHWQRQD